MVGRLGIFDAYCLAVLVHLTRIRLVLLVKIGRATRMADRQARMCLMPSSRCRRSSLTDDVEAVLLQFGNTLRLGAVRHDRSPRHRESLRLVLRPGLAGRPSASALKAKLQQDSVPTPSQRRNLRKPYEKARPGCERAIMFTQAHFPSRGIVKSANQEHRVRGRKNPDQ
jgi:hypothetical protein